MSVIVVYHLFGIQTWVQGSLALETDIDALKRNSVPGDFDRERAPGRIDQQLKRYPKLAVCVLGFAVAGLGVLAMLAGLELPGVAAIFTVGPAAVLIATFAAASAGSWIQGRNAMERARRDL